MENINQTWFQFPSDTDFTYHNIPFGVFSTKKDPEDARPATRVGDYLIDLRELEINNLLIGEQYKSLNRKIFQSRTLNDFMSLTRSDWREVRKTIQQLLHLGSELDKNLELRKKLFFHINDIIMHLPAHIQDYTDFYSSKNHAYNIGVMFRGKDNALQPNWTHLPVGYHGRASTVVVSGTSIHRPRGQTKAPTAEKPSFTECKRLDFELEIGAFIGGKPNKLGEPINVNEAENRIFGIVLMNDWSARDIQNWEYVPLGPFLAENFGTTISPWVVTLDALESFKIDLPKQDPEPFLI
ncbi:hypothetical protein IMG5_186640 [Ichthyophthirius multifiliis]|uniref:Fumarylacetoacetase n=1 Tax=Ichthyophthirius multifiliis TaxID=5932 RepID=G0R3M9_ICHMU|nr:hypothetical protein IMG5_186640 [Ichthyophthirius multifiliis]EGR27912.1 hypothetical protein IMG5_186640 [Ichthyophthirius multifiliis]|eukprot:XP_004027257.1 hypothetical protein IMG5_186640 [Ichthyophthirius multifiliis]